MARKKKTKQENQFDITLNKSEYKMFNKVMEKVEDINSNMNVQQTIGYSSKEDVWMCYMTLKSILEKYDEVHR